MKKVRPALLKGFDQEFLPQDQLQFNALVDLIRRNFERFGFLPIETPSAERIEVLTSKGGTEKEIYALSRLAAQDDDEAATKGALRFDLTVPLARYVAMRERELAFPFRRYQIQRVWRGENPQVKRGRFREFYQCDIDIIGRESLSTLFEAEIPSVIYAVFEEMAIGAFRIRINNRKVLKGILRHFDVPEDGSAEVLRALDKIDKEDERTILAELEAQGLAAKAARELYGVIGAKRETNETLALLAERAYRNETYTQGVDELRKMVDAIRLFGVPDSAFAIDLSVVRGLDYYTGTIYETTLSAHPDIGSICSGGRYDDLASYFTSTRLPGVGISIGLSRLFARLKEANLLKPLARTPAEVLVTTLDPESLERYLRIAASLRAQDINTEVYLERAKIGKQFEYANRKGFRVAVTAGPDEFGRGTVKLKDLSSQLESDVPLDQAAARVKQMLNSKAH
ncbi:MAG TPA: histidine--tRNA ligase [Burkholderiales bacterium]|nr:histidine--tRNA ligase [Burkholderiales bacterium]